jgi:hypothetical protein
MAKYPRVIWTSGDERQTFDDALRATTEEVAEFDCHFASNVNKTVALITDPPASLVAYLKERGWRESSL